MNRLDLTKAGLDKETLEIYSKDRVKRGFSRWDWFDLNFYLLELLPNILDAYLQGSYSTPIQFSDSEWRDILQQMINHFRKAQQCWLSDDLDEPSILDLLTYANENKNISSTLEQKFPNALLDYLTGNKKIGDDNWIRITGDIYHIIFHAEAEAGFDLLKKYLWDLWV